MLGILKKNEFLSRFHRISMRKIFFFFVKKLQLKIIFDIQFDSVFRVESEYIFRIFTARMVTELNWIFKNFHWLSLKIEKKIWKKKIFFFKLDLKIFFDSHFMVVFHAELEYELRIFLSCTVPEFDWKNQKMFILQANSTKNSFLKKFFIVNSKEFLIEDHHLVQFFMLIQNIYSKFP